MDTLNLSSSITKSFISTSAVPLSVQDISSFDRTISSASTVQTSIQVVSEIEQGE